MRIAVHDYAGHPFQFELSRQLARNGHEVRHFFFSDFETPKGRSAVGPDDAPTFSVDPITLGGAFDKGNFVSRGMKNMQYGREAGRRIAAFKPDVVLSGNTPTETQGFIIEAAQSNGAAFAFWMQDFYSLAVGLLLKKRLGVAGAAIGAAYRAAERGQIARSDAIVVISDGFTEELVRFGGSPQKVTTIPNWGALSELPVRAKDNAWSRARGVQSKFVFLYSGTLGLKHDPRLLLQLADAYADDPSVVVLVAAEGAGVDTLKSEVTHKPRANMVFAGLQPIADFPDVLGAADVFITLLEEDAGRFSVPSKVLSYLCAARPILLAAPANNLSVEVVKTAGAGVAVAAGDATGFVEAARQLHVDPARRAACGQAGRAYAERHFDIEAIAKRFENVFVEAIARRKSASGPTR